MCSPNLALFAQNNKSASLVCRDADFVLLQCAAIRCLDWRWFLFRTIPFPRNQKQEDKGDDVLVLCGLLQ